MKDMQTLFNEQFEIQEHLDNALYVKLNNEANTNKFDEFLFLAEVRMLEREITEKQFLALVAQAVIDYKDSCGCEQIGNTIFDSMYRHSGNSVKTSLLLLTFLTKKDMCLFTLMNQHSVLMTAIHNRVTKHRLDMYINNFTFGYVCQLSGLKNPRSPRRKYHWKSHI